MPDSSENGMLSKLNQGWKGIINMKKKRNKNQTSGSKRNEDNKEGWQYYFFSLKSRPTVTDGDPSHREALSRAVWPAAVALATRGSDTCIVANEDVMCWRSREHTEFQRLSVEKNWFLMWLLEHLKLLIWLMLHFCWLALFHKALNRLRKCTGLAKMFILFFLYNGSSST